MEGERGRKKRGLVFPLPLPSLLRPPAVDCRFIFSQDDGSDEEETKKTKKKSDSKKRKTEKCEGNGLSKTDKLAEMEFIDSAVKATKEVKKSKKEKKKKKQK